MEFKAGISYKATDGEIGLIESDWNLKLNPHVELLDDEVGLIESDWNLKVRQPSKARHHQWRINRIRLEFKDQGEKPLLSDGWGLIESDWNLKGNTTRTRLTRKTGLIESDWNLKEITGTALKHLERKD